MALTESLTESFVDSVIQEVTRHDAPSALQQLHKRGLLLRQAKGRDLGHLVEFVSSAVNKDANNNFDCNSILDLKTPSYFGIGIYGDDGRNVLEGVVTFYLAYSTWDGRVLYLDRLWLHLLSM